MTPRKGMLTNGTTELRAWRYAVPGNNAYLCWARLTIIQTGPLRSEMMVVSDRGCYAALFAFDIENCPRSHLVTIRPERASLLLLGNWPKVFDAAATFAAAKAAVIEARRKSRLSKERALSAWDSLMDYVFQSSESDFLLWCDEMADIWPPSDLIELACYDYPGDLKRFIAHDFPRLQAAIRWDLFCEAWADIGREMFLQPELIGQRVKLRDGVFRTQPPFDDFVILSVSHEGNNPLYRLRALRDGVAIDTWEGCAPELFEVVLP